MFSDPLHKEWDIWDYRLLKAHYILQDWYRDGIPIWWDESERVTFNAKPRLSKSRAAIERAQEAANKNNKKSVPGRYYVAEPTVTDGGGMPTREEWMKEQEAKNKNSAPVTKFGVAKDKHKITQGRK